MAEAIRDGLRLEAIAADIAGDGDTALELLSVNAYDIAVLDRDIPGPTGDEIAKHIVASGSGMPILMLTAADRLDDKTTGFELGADDYLTKPFALWELVLRLRALDRRRAHHRPPVREIAGLRLDPFRREVYRDGRYVALTRKQFAVLEVLVAAEGGVVSAEELLARAWDENADPFTNAVRITVSALRKRLGEPWIISSGTGPLILMLTAADRLDDKASGFELGADDYLTKPFELQELVLRLRALNRRRGHNRPPVRDIAGLRLDPFRREVYRDGRYVALTRKQFAVLEVLVAAEGGVVSAEELLERAWDENADPFTNAVRITVSALRKRLGEPWIIATVAGVGYRIDAQPDGGREALKRG